MKDDRTTDKREPQRTHMEKYAPPGPTKAHDLQAAGYEPEPVLRAIRRKCLWCSGGDPKEVASCLVPDCALFPFRMGKNPWRAEATDAQREASRRNAARLLDAVKGTESGATKPGAATPGPEPEAESIRP
jgi:hypothetical protein